MIANLGIIHIVAGTAVKVCPSTLAMSDDPSFHEILTWMGYGIASIADDLWSIHPGSMVPFKSHCRPHIDVCSFQKQSWLRTACIADLAGKGSYQGHPGTWFCCSWPRIITGPSGISDTALLSLESYSRLPATSCNHFSVPKPRSDDRLQGMSFFSLQAGY